MEARVTHLFLKPAHGAEMQSRSAVSAVADKGLVGDAAFGTSRRQVLVVDTRALSEFDLAPGMIRENITLSGISLRGMLRGTRLHLDDVTLEITGDCTPCDFLETLHPGLKETIVGRRGLLARVAHGGELKVGALLRVQPAEPIGANLPTA